MRLALFRRISEGATGPVCPGLYSDDGVLDFDELVKDLDHYSPQSLMVDIINHFDALRPGLERLTGNGTPVPFEGVQLLAPVPRPGKMLNCIGNYWEHQSRDPRPLNMFLKSPDAVIGPGDTIVLPNFTEPYVFQHEAELGVVIKGPAKEVSRDDWRKAVFGYTCVIDVSARAEGRSTWRRGSWMGKSFDTFGPVGPCILTADEVDDPNNLEVRFWNSGELYHHYVTNDMEHRVPELIEWASTLMTLNSGDIISCGTNHEGLGPLQDGDTAEIEIQGVGRLTVGVRDPLKRSWPRGVYMGPNSTNAAAVAERNPAT